MILSIRMIETEVPEMCDTSLCSVVPEHELNIVGISVLWVNILLLEIYRVSKILSPFNKPNKIL